MQLEERQDEEWAQVDRLVGEKKARAYDEAIQRLVALRELSVDRGTERAFAARLNALVEQHRTRQAFRYRLRSAGLA